MAEAGFAGIGAHVTAVLVPRVSHIVALYLITSVCGLVDAACFLSMGRVFAEIMTGNLLFLCFYIGTGQSIFGDAKYLLVIAVFLLGALAGGRLLRGPRAEVRIGFADAFALGSDASPERSTTPVIEVSGLINNSGMSLRGPGICDEVRLGVAGLPTRFWAERAALAELFPRGLDILFVSGDKLAALPRSTRIEA